MTIIQPVILSGGAGTRLWPASRSSYPKQLLPLVSDNTLLQDTILRLDGIADLAQDSLIVCNDRHRFLITAQLRDIQRRARLVLEPEGRDTAPAVTLAALLAEKDAHGQSPLLLVMPADHVIAAPEAFHRAVALGRTHAEAGSLVIFGVRPTRAETAFGYIQAASADDSGSAVKAFVEKPDAATAETYLREGGYYWNAGIFLFSAETYLNALRKHAPEILAACRASVAKARVGGEFMRPDAALFRESPIDSIDYALMEKTRSAVVIPLNAGWSDVGSWSTLHAAASSDSDGNRFVGDVVARDCYNTFISAENRLVAAVGLKDTVVVETKDAVLVTAKEQSQDVRFIVDELRRRSRTEADTHRQVYRPWGSYDSIDSGEGFQVKRLVVNPGGTLSLQKHAHRAEHWTVVRGKARITLNERVFDLEVNESTDIPVGAVHRIENPFDAAVHIIEVQCGDYLGEDDIVRFADEYGREGTTS